MAEGKKSFVAYSDWSGTFKAVPDDVAGQLIKYIFSYVNDENPEPHENYVVNALFEQIKSTLKRDLNKWEKQREQRSKAGKESAKKRKATKSNERSTNVNEKTRKATVSVNGNVSVSDSVSDSVDTNVSFYGVSDFLIDWNELRTKHLKKPSFVKSMPHFDRNEFTKLSKDYTREDFKNALTGLFKQDVMPNGNTTMQTNPSHFLKFFNSYFSAYHDQNKNLYGKKDKTPSL